MTAEDKIQVTWRVVVRGEASPRLRVFDEGWLLDSRIGDADIVRCDSAGTEDLSVADSISEFSRFSNPSMSILILVPRKPAPELEQSWDGEVASFVVSVGLLRAFKKTKPAEDYSLYNLLHWALNNRSHEVGFECLQVPTQSKRPRQNTVQSSPVQWIIPHKAPLLMLETCLRAVGDSRGSADIVRCASTRK